MSVSVGLIGPVDQLILFDRTNRINRLPSSIVEEPRPFMITLSICGVLYHNIGILRSFGGVMMSL
jgi:hypothetical protein